MQTCNERLFFSGGECDSSSSSGDCSYSSFSEVSPCCNFFELKDLSICSCVDSRHEENYATDNLFKCRIRHSWFLINSISQIHIKSHRELLNQIKTHCMTFWFTQDTFHHILIESINLFMIFWNASKNEHVLHKYNHYSNLVHDMIIIF